VFGALTGLPVETGYGAGRRANVGVVKVPDPRLDALAAIYRPRRVVPAEITFRDLAGAGGAGVDRALLDAMREVDALCQVVRAFADAAGAPADPLAEIAELETETLLADLALAEQRALRLRKERKSPRELALMEKLKAWLEESRALRTLPLAPEEESLLTGYRFLSRLPLLLVLNVAEEAAAKPAPPEVEAAARERGLGLVVLSAQVEMEIAQMAAEDQPEFLASLGLEAPASHRFVREAFALLDLVSMLTVGPDECRAWPIRRGTQAPRAAGKIHSDLERGFIRAQVVEWRDLVELGSEARCREAGRLRVEGKDYEVRDGDVVTIRFAV